MPKGVFHPGMPPTEKPATRSKQAVGTGESGGAGGLTPNPIRAGVNIAFGSTIHDEVPLWQLLEELGPT